MMNRDWLEKQVRQQCVACKGTVRLLVANERRLRLPLHAANAFLTPDAFLDMVPVSLYFALQAAKRAAQEAAEKAAAEANAAQEAAEAAGVQYKRGRGRPVGSKTKNHRPGLPEGPPAETAQEVGGGVLG